MILTCQKCDSEFENANVVGYCESCREDYARMRQERHDKQAVATEAIGAIHIAGRWGDPKESPQSAFDEISQRQVCGMCGSDELECGYGFAGGFGLGSYMCCCECWTIQDFHEDME